VVLLWNVAKIVVRRRPASDETGHSPRP